MNRKIKWDYEWERQMTFFIADDIYLSWSNPHKKYAYPVAYILFVGDDEYGVELYFNFKEINRLSKKSLNRFLTNHLTKPWANECERQCDELKNYIFNELLAVNLSDLNRQQLLKAFRKFYKIYIRTVKHICVIRILNREIQNCLDRYFNKNFSNQENASKAFNLLTAPEKLSIDAIEEIDFLKLVRRTMADPGSDIAPFLARHLNRYVWLPVGYRDEKELRLGQLRNKLEKALKEKINPTQEIHEIKSHVKSIVREKRALVRKFRISREIVAIGQQAALGAYYKDLIRERLNMAHYYSRPLFNEIAKRLNLTFKEVKMLGYEEINQAIAKNKNFKRTIKKRFNGYILVKQNGRRTELYGAERRQFIKENFSPEFHPASLKGTGVSLGKATGIVVNLKKPTAKIKLKDFILVTTMTTPELVPLMKRASAVVTDEGGITCHAAIVSRELKIPCVVGTRVATQVFKDGDRVEVDATNGVVRKL